MDSKTFLVFTFFVGRCIWCEAANKHNVTDLVYFDIDIDGEPAGRIVFGLFGSVVPITVENFIRLAVHDKGFGYTGSRFTSMRKAYYVVGGAIPSDDYSIGKSWFGASFPAENFKLRHYGPGWVSMARNVESKFDCAFFILTNDLCVMREWFDDRYVVFGAVVNGMRTVLRIENVETFGYAPTNPVTVRNSGTLKLREKLEIEEGHITGDILSSQGELLPVR